MRVKVYGRSTEIGNPAYCKWCAAAKDLLNRRGIPFEFQDINEPEFDLQELVTNIAPGAKTVPVVVVNDVWIGGYDQLNDSIDIIDKRYQIERLAISYCVWVKFVKADGTVREMNATLNPFRLTSILGDDQIAKGVEPKHVVKDLYTLPVLDTDKGQWRSIPIDRVLEYRVA